MDTCHKYLAVCTSKNVLKIFDVSRREPKQLGTSGKFENDAGESFGQIKSIRCNSDGTKISIVCDVDHDGAVTTPDTRIFVYMTEVDRVFWHDFGPMRFPISHFWDTAEPRVMSCETQSLHGNPDALARQDTQEETKQDLGPASLTNVSILFSTTDNGVILQDSFVPEVGFDTFVALQVPRMYFVSNSLSLTEGEKSGTGRLKFKLMRDFIGLEDVDESTKTALLDFSYFLTIGNLDEAYRAVKTIQNMNVWENMAHMCVKTKRIDVAEVCLSKMGHARGAAAVREAKKHSEVSK